MSTINTSQKPVSLVATRIVQESLNENVELSSLTRLAMSDPGFAARVVATVNCGAFGISRQVSDVAQACTMIGVRGLRNLGLSLVVSDMVPLGADGGVLLANSLRRAVASRLIAEALGVSPLDEFFTAGLFLEIGILQGARTDLKLSAEIARMPFAHRPGYERACGRVDHMQVGADLARDFMLREDMVQAVQLHHAEKPPQSMIGRVTWAAERLAGAFEAVDLQRGREDALMAAKAIALPLPAVEKILARMPELVAENSKVFDRELPSQESLEALQQRANERLVDLNQSYERLLKQMEQLLGEREQLTIQLKRANEELSNLAATDALTGLANRRSFEDAMSRDLARAQRTGTPLSVLVLDVDHFKKVNDTYGHPTGDYVLTRVAETLKHALRTGDLAARWGGEEFVALLPGSDAVGGKIAAERIRTAIQKTLLSFNGANFTVTISIGVAGTAKLESVDAGRKLIERADAALYQAKRAGRNQVAVDR